LELERVYVNVTADGRFVFRSDAAAGALTWGSSAVTPSVGTL